MVATAALTVTVVVVEVLTVTDVADSQVPQVEPEAVAGSALQLSQAVPLGTSLAGPAVLLVEEVLVGSALQLSQVAVPEAVAADDFTLPPKPVDERHAELEQVPKPEL